MNPELPKSPREEMELRLTALLLGELSAAEAAAVREAVAEDSELAKLHDDLKATIQLVQSAATKEVESVAVEAAQLKLSEARRKRLLTAFVIPPLKSKDRKPKPVFQLGLVELAAVLAILVTLAAFFLPALQAPKSRAQYSRSDLGLDAEQPPRRSWGFRRESETATTPPAPQRLSRDNALSEAGVGYTVVDPSDRGIVDNRLQASGQVNPLTDEAGKDTTAAGRPEAESSDYLKQAQRRLAVTETPPAAPPAAPAKPRAAIVLPSVIETDDDKPAAGADVNRSWTGSTALRGFYDDNVERSGVTELSADTLGFEVAKSASVSERQLGIAAAGDATHTAEQNRFYRFSGGGAGGGGVGGAASQSGAATPAAVDRVPILGDLPTLGKAFRESETLKRDGALLADNFATSDFAAVLDSGGANPHLWYGANTARGEKIDSLAIVDSSNGLPSSKLQEESQLGRAVVPSGNVSAETAMRGAIVAGVEAAQDKSGADSLGVNAGQFGAFVPQAKSLEPREAISTPPAQQPATSGGFALSPTPATPPDAEAEGALMERYGTAAGEAKQGVAVQPSDPAQRLNESLAAGSRSERGRALLREGKDSAEVGQNVEAAARFKTVTEANLGNQISEERLELANGAKYRVTERLDETVSKDALAAVAQTPRDTAGKLESRRFQIDPNVLRQGIETVTGTGITTPDHNHSEGQITLLGVPRVFVAGGTADRSDQVQGGVRFLIRTNHMAEIHQGVHALFSKLGVDLSTNGKTVFYNDRAGELFVRGTKEDLDAIAEITQALAIKQPEVQADTPLPRKAATNAPIPQPEIQTSENAFSTFSLNVSDVSFKLAAASLEKGQMPDAATVRSEEFINAFDYRDPEAAPGAAVAFTWERARYPFAHNRDLLRFSLKTAAAGRQAGRPLNVVLLLDNSGSMERADRVQIIREALAVLAKQLQPQDKLSVITFARTPRLVADGISGDKAGELAEHVSDLTPQGGTNLEDAMNLAYATAARHYFASGINRVVLLTDGAANLGNVEPDALKQKVEAQRKQGIALDCFGIGWEGFNDDLLEVLSRNGDGRYGFINSPEEAATEFAGELAGALEVAASDVKVQVEFNPKRTTAYRQLGYAKHQLTKEQFRDNTVDAAEIAAQEAGNALYTVEVNPAGEGPLATVRVRYKIPGKTDYREQAWDVPFTGSVAPLEHASPAMRLAASASAFSEWLVASPFAGEVTPDRLLGYLSGVPEVYGADGRPKKLEWMIRQAKSMEGK